MSGESRPFEPAALSAKDWEVLWRQILSFAEYQVRRLRWRGQSGGVLPEGFDPNSIAAQAIMEFLQQFPEPSQPCSTSDSLSPCEKSPFSPSEGEKARMRGSIPWQIKRLVLKQVTRLHHLKENHIVTNEADLAPVVQNGDFINTLEFIPASDLQPDEALIQKESLIEYKKLKYRFQLFLEGNQNLLYLFALRCDGVTKPQLLASQLNLRVRTVENLQKRLRRKWFAFLKNSASSLALAA